MITERADEFVVRGQDLLLAAAAAIAVFFGGLAAATILWGAGPGAAQTMVYVGVGIEAAALTGAVFLVGPRRRDVNWRGFGLRPITPRWVAASVGLGALCAVLAGITIASIQTLLDRPVSSPQLPFLAPGGFSWIALGAMMALAGVLAPFGEELFFRGLLYRWLRQRWGVPAGVGLSSLLFGAIHGFAEVAVGAFLVGVVLALVFERSRSLWTCAIVHAIFNCTSITFMFAQLAARQGVS